MTFKSQALELAKLLNHTSKMWSDEIMNIYPVSLKAYPQDWIESLEQLNQAELYKIDCKIIIDKIKNTPIAMLMTEINELTQIPKIAESPEIPLEAWAFNGIKKKKEHEIQKITPFLKAWQNDVPFESIVDIGGGVGHLSRVLSHYHGIPTICLDQNSEFQNIGIERLKKYRRLPGAAEVEFVNLTFGSDNDPKKLNHIFKPTSLTLGLHTCGPLANILIETTIKQKNYGLLNFGCCYHRLNPDHDFPLSNFYKEEKLPRLNLYSLTLATRAHGPMSFDDYKTKERVKYYRYALHLFLMEQYQQTLFTEVGECPIKIYWEPFSHYIRGRLVELNIDHTFSDDDFNSFYHRDDIQKQLRVMFLCNIIRWQLGRALEVYLILDRCLYLEEKGYEVSCLQFFEEDISPRNIGISAIKPLL